MNRIPKHQCWRLEDKSGGEEGHLLWIEGNMKPLLITRWFHVTTRSSSRDFLHNEKMALPLKSSPYWHRQILVGTLAIKCCNQRAICVWWNQVKADPSSEDYSCELDSGTQTPNLAKDYSCVMGWSECRPLVRGLFMRTWFRSADPFVSNSPVEGTRKLVHSV
jgi:hypothetical protein